MVDCVRIISVLTLLVFASGCTAPRDNGDARLIQEIASGIEEIGGKYNLTLVLTEVSTGDNNFTVKKISYVMDGRVIEPDQILPDEMRPGLDWIRAATPRDSVIMSWWDYGHAIRAYTEREPVIDAPSRQILATTVSKHIGKSPDEIDCESCAPHDVILDVAGLLMTEDAAGAHETMKEYGASYLYVHREDRDKSVSLSLILGREPGEITSTVLGRALGGEEIEGFELAYEDDVSVIYRLIE
jgi:hypothetical protein